METDTVSLPRTGSDIYMYNDVIALYKGRVVAERLRKEPKKTYTKFMKTWKSSQKARFFPLIEDWIREIENHSSPIERLAEYLTTLEDEGQEFRSCFPYYAFPSKKSNDEYLEQVLSICDEFWMVRKIDIPNE